MSLTLTLAGLYFFFRFLEKNWNLIPASFFFALTFLTYQGAKLSTIIVIFLLVFFYRKKLWTLFKADKKMVSIAFCLGLVVSLPAILSLITGKTGRLAVFSIFSYPRPPEYLNAFLKKGNVIPGSFDYYFFYSEGFNFLRGILGRWFNHFSTRFLFFEGDWQNPRHSIPYHGQLLLATILPLIYGLYLNLKRAKKLHWFFLSWLFLSPFPAVLSRDQVQAVRSLPMVIPLVVVSSYGVLVILKKFGKAGAFSLATLYIVSFAYFLDSYFVHLTPKNANYWYYGYKQVFEKYSKAEKKKIIVEQSYDQPYIYYLFYTGYDPARYQEKAHLVQTGSDVGQVGTAGDIRFLQFGWPAAREKQVLYIGKAVTIPKEVGEGFRLLDEIHYPNGEAAFRVVESLP